MIMIRFVLKRILVYRFRVRVYAQSMKVLMVLGASTKEFTGGVTKIIE